MSEVVQLVEKVDKLRSLEVLAGELNDLFNESQMTYEVSVDEKAHAVRVAISNPLWDDALPGSVVANMMRVGFLAKISFKDGYFIFHMLPKMSMT